jgi:hypothetical protein
VYERLHALIRKAWWTDAEGVTDGTGAFSTDAVFGRHQLTVTTPVGREITREVRWERERENRFEVSV